MYIHTFILYVVVGGVIIILCCVGASQLDVE